MFNQYDPNVKTCITFLRLINVKVSSATVNETLQNHPDWPSLLCVTDSLNKWNILNGAGKVDVSDIDQLPVPFIAYTHDREAPLAIVTQVGETAVHVFHKNYNKPKTESREEFLKNWNGVYLLAEPDEHSGESKYEANKRKAFFSSLIPVSAFAALITLSFLFLYKVTGANEVGQFYNAGGIYLQYIITLAGVVVTALLLWYEIDKTNPLLQKVCTGIAKGNCNAILSGKQAKVFSWLSWSEVGFFYFTGSLLVILSGSEVSISLLGWLNLFALPYTVFSVYYQWRVAKQWCVLCLAVQAILVLGAINIIANNFLFPVPGISFLFVANCLLLFALPILLWYALKPFILRLQEAKTTKREYLRIKFNTDTFETLLKKQKKITISTNGIGIDIGNQNATNQIIKVCNPYCGPCATVHPKLDEILEHNKNVKAKIIFTTPNDENNKALKPVKHLLAVAAQNNEQKTKQALDDWYLPSMKDYEIFAAKYKMNGELDEQGSKIEVMDTWCKATDIAYTPTIFLNGYQLPDAYSIEDLEYFLME
jgi:uncharacterized membrane protein/thiol-disulfide isomerase/thioredoxin